MTQLCAFSTEMFYRDNGGGFYFVEDINYFYGKENNSSDTKFTEVLPCCE